MKKISHSFFLAIFFIGALLGLILITLATWADLEAAAYGFDHMGGKRLGTLTCPLLMTANETGAFSVKVANPTQGKLSPSIRTEVTVHLMPVDTTTTSVQLAPGESKRVEWKIGPENAEFEQFILVHVYVYGFYPMAARENTCGVFIINLPSNGAVITWTMVVLSLLGMGIGLYGLMRARQPAGADMLRFTLLFFLVIAGLITSFMEWWLQGVIITVVALLLAIVTVGFTVRK